MPVVPGWGVGLVPGRANVPVDSSSTKRGGRVVPNRDKCRHWLQHSWLNEEATSVDHLYIESRLGTMESRPARPKGAPQREWLRARANDSIESQEGTAAVGVSEEGPIATPPSSWWLSSLHCRGCRRRSRRCCVERQVVQIG